MKFGVFIFMSLLLIGSATAIIDATYTCTDSYCIEGTKINFTLRISNPTDKFLDTTRIELYDKNFDIIVSSKEFSKIRILPGEELTINFTDTVIIPPDGFTFMYHTCAYAVFSNESGITSAGRACSEHTRSLTVLPLEKMECKENEDCEDVSWCNPKKSYKCVPLECRENEFVWNHQCRHADWVLIGLLGTIVVLIVVFVLVKKIRQR